MIGAGSSWRTSQQGNKEVKGVGEKDSHVLLVNRKLPLWVCTRETPDLTKNDIQSWVRIGRFSYICINFRVWAVLKRSCSNAPDDISKVWTFPLLKVNSIRTDGFITRDRTPEDMATSTLHFMPTIVGYVTWAAGSAGLSSSSCLDLIVSTNALTQWGGKLMACKLDCKFLRLVRCRAPGPKI